MEMGTTQENLRADSLMVGSVEKAFRVLEAFTPTKKSFNLTELAAETGMNKSAAQRFTHSLEHLGYLVKDPVTKRYQLSVRLLERSAAYISSNPLIGRATPYLLHLSKETDETVSLSVLDESDIIFISRFINRNMIHTDVVNGTRLPGYCTAPGIAILAHLPRERAIKLMAGTERKQFTSFTTTDLDTLVAKLDRTVQQGYAIAVSEIFLGDISIAAPVFDVDGSPIGAINIAVPEARYSAEKAAAKFAPLLTAAARNASLG